MADSGVVDNKPMPGIQSLFRENDKCKILGVSCKYSVGGYYEHNNCGHCVVALAKLMGNSSSRIVEQVKS